MSSKRIAIVVNRLYSVFPYALKVLSLGTTNVPIVGRAGQLSSYHEEASAIKVPTSFHCVVRVLCLEVRGVLNGCVE